MLDYVLMDEFGIANKTTFQFESRILFVWHGHQFHKNDNNDD